VVLSLVSPLRTVARSVPWLASLLVLGAADLAHAANEDVLVEFHYMPVADLQVAIWLTDADGNFVQDVFVTQSTGTLGIGNRPGRWDFLSSWRFPYGPRPQVLPVWAHARGKTYPALVFHDDDPGDENSLGWHENSSSSEPYYCRPLTAVEQENLLEADVMSCPSPAVFQSDKGRFSASETSKYPPRNDLVTFEDGADHPDIMMFGGLNDLDAFTGATPHGEDPEMTTTVVALADAEAGPLVAWIEVHLEHDENPDWEFTREDDHYIDTRLASYGIEYLGQPSVVFKVPFDPLEQAFAGTDAYAGYGEFDGTSGTLYSPDGTISTSNGKGGDRLRMHEKNGETFRFGVYSHGPGSGSVDPTGGDDDGGSDDGVDDDGGTDDDSGDDGWGCQIAELPPVEDLVLEPVSFDRVRVHFTVPPLDADAEVRRITMYSRPGDMPLTEDNATASRQTVPSEADCGEAPAPGVPTWCEVDQLFGNFEYQIGLRYEDICSNKSALAAAATMTPAQEFATVEGVCFVATAAWGAAWTDRVAALRHFRDRAMRTSAVGSAFVQFYYANSPMLARAIAPRPWARALARSALEPVVDMAVVATGR
jgi:hypothetical protein